MIKVAVAAADPVYSLGLKAAIQSTEDMEFLASTCLGVELAMIAQQQHPDVIVAELGLDDINGVNLVKEVKQISPITEFLALTRRSNYACFIPCLQAGMAGALLKSSAVEDILRAIRSISNGESVIKLDVLRSAALNLGGNRQDSISIEKRMLAADETEVLRLLAQGYGTREIAEALSFSDRATQAKLSRACKKLGARTRYEAISIGVRLGWIEVNDV